MKYHFRLFCPKAYKATSGKILKEKQPSKRKLKQQLKAKAINFFLTGETDIPKEETQNESTTLSTD